MGQATLDRALELVSRLDVGELRQVEARVRGLLLRAQRLDDAQRLDAALVGSGLVARLPQSSDIAPRRRGPVPISGAPLSKTIIKDRR